MAITNIHNYSQPEIKRKKDIDSNQHSLEKLHEIIWF
jgi:hypothetical protein